MKNFLSALRFLTIIPARIGSARPEDMGAALVYFPVIGLFLGLLLVVVSSVCTMLALPQLTVSIIVVTALIMCTGGMHLDGAADTADAFFSGKKRDDMLLIMRDPHIGALAAVSIVCVILLKVSAVYALSPSARIPALVLCAVISRWSLVMSLFLFPYARAEGKAGIFVKRDNQPRFLIATLITLLYAFFFSGARGIAYCALAGIVTHWCGRVSCARIGGITGDTLGAVCEIVEIVVLYAAVLLSG